MDLQPANDGEWARPVQIIRFRRGADNGANDQTAAPNGG
jgi:hypothetical protein